MKYKVAITGVGGSAGMSCIKALRGYELHGFDCNPLSAGFKFVKSALIPSATDLAFFESLRGFCKEMDVLIPTVDEELPIIAERKNELPCKVVISSLRSVHLCLDKRKMVEVLARGVPKTMYPSNEIPELTGAKFPLVVKPCRGHGSRDIYICKDEEDLRYAIKCCANRVSVIIQECLDPPEYSVDTLSDLDGNCLVAVPRERIEVKGGVIWRGTIVRDERIERLAIWAVEKLKMVGPAVVQIRQNKIIEINPRFGGSTILTVKAGVNTPKLAVKIFMGEKVGKIPVPKQLSMARYFEEVYF